MNPNYGYQLYQVRRTRTRAETLADDAQAGRQAAALSRGGRALMGRAAAAAASALNAIRTIKAHPAYASSPRRTSENVPADGIGT